MGGSHGHGAGEVSMKAAPGAHATMLALVIPAVLASIVGMILLWPSQQAADDALASLPGFGDRARESGVVLSITQAVCEGGTSEDRLPDGTIPDTVPCAFAQVRVLSGPDADEIVEISVPAALAEDGVSEGTRIVLDRFSPADDPGLAGGEGPNVGASGDRYVFDDFDRGRALWLIAAAFAVLVVAVGRLRGLASIAGLLLTFATIAFFLLPALREGSNAVLVAVCSAIVIMTAVLYLAHGFSARTTAALLGTVLGLLLCAGLAVWATSLTRIGGVSDEETFTLSLLVGRTDLSGILHAGIIIAVLGVLNDVTITQASSVWEVHGHAPTLRFGELFRAGMRIGRDHLASTVYTIAFAYAGAALPSLILIDIYGQPLDQVLTSLTVAEEIVRTVVGTIGLVMAVPATTAIAAAAVAPPWLRAGRRTEGEPEAAGPGAAGGGAAGARAAVEGPAAHAATLEPRSGELGRPRTTGPLAHPGGAPATTGPRRPGRPSGSARPREPWPPSVGGAGQPGGAQSRGGGGPGRPQATGPAGAARPGGPHASGTGRPVARPGPYPYPSPPPAAPAPAPASAIRPGGVPAAPGGEAAESEAASSAARADGADPEMPPRVRPRGKRRAPGE